MEDSSSVLLSCAACPKLIELQLGYNYLTEFVPDAVAENRFPNLNTLSLAFNYIATEEALMPVAYLMKLELLVLYGNPLLGPSCEDPTGETIEQLAMKALDLREEAWTNRPLDILTEVPRKRDPPPPKAPPGEGKASQTAARRSKYRGVSLASVEDELLPPAAEFRAVSYT